MPEFTPTRLGHTGLKVGRLGVAASYGAPAAAFEAAFERGCNYFYLGSGRHRAGMREAIRNICHKGHRDQLVIALQTYARWGHLLNPKKMPPGEATPAATDCYRFALSNPNIDVCLCGPRDTKEMETALQTLALGPLSPPELQRMQRIGDHIHQQGKGFFG